MGLDVERGRVRRNGGRGWAREEKAGGMGRRRCRKHKGFRRSTLSARSCERARMRLHRRGWYAAAAANCSGGGARQPSPTSAPRPLRGSCLIPHIVDRHPLLLIVFPLCLAFLWPRHFYCRHSAGPPCVTPDQTPAQISIGYLVSGAD